MDSKDLRFKKYRLLWNDDGGELGCYPPPVGVDKLKKIINDRFEGTAVDAFFCDLGPCAGYTTAYPTRLKGMDFIIDKYNSGARLGGIMSWQYAENVRYLSAKLFNVFFVISIFFCFQCFAGEFSHNLLESPEVKIVSSYAEHGSCDKAEYIIDANVNSEFLITGGNTTAFAVIDLGRGCVIESVEIMNGKCNPVGWLSSLAVGPDPNHLRELLGRGINLPVWRGGDSESVSITPAVGRYVRLGFFSARPEGAITGIKITGTENRPERHLLCWSSEVLLS
jgi:hypothetical protein